jgi:hypothetical protein
MEGDWSSIAIGFILGMMFGWLIMALLVLSVVGSPKPKMHYFISPGTKVRAFGKTNDRDTAGEFATWLTEVSGRRYWWYVYTGR